MKRVGLVLSILLLLSSHLFAANEAIYYPDTGLLQLPLVKVNGGSPNTSYRVNLSDTGNFNFQISELEEYKDNRAFELTGLQIQGGSTVSENGSLQLSAVALWSNGTWTDVTPQVTWSENSPYIQDIENGLVRTASISNDTSATVTATYEYNGILASDNKSLTITANFTSRLVLELANLDYPQWYFYPLEHMPFDGISFELDGILYDLYIDFSYIYTYGDLVYAIEEALYYNGLTEINVYESGSFEIYNDYGYLISGPVIKLEVQNHEFSSPVLIWKNDLVGEYNTYHRFYVEGDDVFLPY